MINASVHRDTRFELVLVQQGPNSFGVIAVERDNGGRVQLEVHESAFTEDEMRLVHSAFELLERKAADVYAEHEAKPEDLKAIISAAAVAKQELAAATAELEALKRTTE